MASSIWGRFGPTAPPPSTFFSWFDPSAQVIQVRSASRLGKGDMGANRQRIEAVRTALAAAP
ncbi:DUF1499 domain-containing protein [Roseateles sp. GG27B]